MTSQVARFVVGTDTGVGTDMDMCIVAECVVGDVGGIVAVVVGTLFLFLKNLWMTCPPVSQLSAGSQ